MGGGKSTLVCTVPKALFTEGSLWPPLSMLDQTAVIVSHVKRDAYMLIYFVLICFMQKYIWDFGVYLIKNEWHLLVPFFVTYWLNWRLCGYEQQIHPFFGVNAVNFANYIWNWTHVNYIWPMDPSQFNWRDSRKCHCLQIEASSVVQ